jgi:transposase
MHWQEFADVDPERLIFVDEAGSNISMTRTHARAPKGARAHGSQPFKWGDNITMIGGMGLRGVVAMMTINGGTTGQVFRAFVDQVLGPQLRPGDIVVMDNLSAHKVAGIRKAVEARGARAVYLPPYSPDLNPIEQCWSKLKNAMRGYEARTRETLEAGLVQAMDRVTATDIRGWFSHCGYP